jgi:DNA ligase 1
MKFTSQLNKAAWIIRKQVAANHSISPLLVSWKECLLMAQETQANPNTLSNIKPMLAVKRLDVKKPIDFTNAYVQPKLDGNRAVLGIDGLYSRNGKLINVKHVTDAIAVQCNGLQLDGELYCHDLTLQQITSIIKNGKKDKSQLQYWIYDVAIPNMPFSERIKLIPNLSGCLKLVPTYKVNSWAEVNEWHAKFLAQGYEGTILRCGNQGYEHGKRSNSLIKIKDYQDSEFEIVDCIQGKPYYKNGQEYQQAIYICATANGKTFNCTAPGNVAAKDAAWVNRRTAIGRMLTVKYFNLIDGIPQQPVALGLREAWDC